MKRRILSIILTLAMVLSLLPTVSLTAVAADGPWAGSGTKDAPYLISSREDLEAIATAVNGNNDLAGLYFEQTQDINLGGEDNPWPVIGRVFGNTPHPFNGVYDGGDFKIFGLFVGTTDEDGDPVGVEHEDAGLFGHVGKDGIIRRVHVVDCKVYNKSLYVGGIAGRNEGLVEYCSSDATDPNNSSGIVKGKWQYVGGIVGYNFGKISYCYSECDVIGEQKVGGITGGQNGGTVVNCYFRGYIYAGDITRAYAGGIAGENDGNSHIDNCYSDGIVEGRNENAYCGAIAGSNDTGSTVDNCFWEDSEETGVPGIGSGSGDVNHVEQRTSEEFASGQVAWELAQGTDGEGWGQNMEGGITEDGTTYDKDKHPHFVGAPDKSIDTTPVYRVTFTTSYSYDVVYVDPGEDAPLPKLPENTKWFADGVEFDGKNIQKDTDAVAIERVTFGGKTDPLVNETVYSPAGQTLVVDLDRAVAYEKGDTGTWGRFTYTITGGNETLQAELSEDGKTLALPTGTKANEDGYVLIVNAHEKEPLLVPFSMDSFGIEDVTLQVKVIVNKATPVITVNPTISVIDYGQTLGESTLTGGQAQHPTAGTEVPGTFTWDTPETIPTVPEAANVGYSVTFTPENTENYNTATTTLTLTVNKVPSAVVDAPRPLDRVYDGIAQELIIPGTAEGGTMKYWLGDDAEYSATIPSRAKADTYTVYYKVVGDDNHDDTAESSISVTIRPCPVDIEPGHVTYNGIETVTLALEGVTLSDGSTEAVAATLTASSEDAGEYVYAEQAGAGKYTVALSNGNYTVGKTGTLIVDPLPVVLAWNGQLTLPFTGKPQEVTATVINAVREDDAFVLEYTGNQEEEVGDYTAEVIGLGNGNYTREGGQNLTQLWHIIPEDQNVTMDEVEPVTYGDEVEFVVRIASPVPSGPQLLSVAQDKVEFSVNGTTFDPVSVTYEPNGDNDTGTATIKVRAIAENGFFVGSNPVKASYGGNRHVVAEDAYTTVTVEPKAIKAYIFGDTSKTYDGSDVAVGLDISLDAKEICGNDDVTVTAESFAYVAVTAEGLVNSSNVVEASMVVAQNVTLTGAQSGNYTVEPVAADGSIRPKVVGLEWRGFSDLVYTGQPVNVNATALELVPGDICEVTVEGGQETDAGTYTAKATALSNSNYTLPDDVTREYTIEKAAPGNLTAPEARGLVYTGVPQTLMTAGEAEGGTWWYSMDGEHYTTAVPQRTNAEAYTVWYKLVGNDNYNDTEPQTVTVTILPYPMEIGAQRFTYNGGSTFPVVLDGVNGEIVVATLSAYSKDAGSYAYATETGEKQYTVGLSSPNYTVDTAGTLTIEEKAAVLSWSQPLNFVYNGQPHTVTATVGNAEFGDEFALTYTGVTTATNAGNYTATVTGLGNANYILDDPINASQPWHITKADSLVTLATAGSVVYGDELTLSVTVVEAIDARPIVPDPSAVTFYVNGQALDGTPSIQGDRVTLTIPVTSANGFYAGANAVRAVYSENDNEKGSEASVTVTVYPKPIAATITGTADKVYDGNDYAPGLSLKLSGVEKGDEVTVQAIYYAYDSANAGENKTVTALNVTLEGAQGGNYALDTQSVTTTGVIRQKEVVLEWSGYAGLVYTGEPVNVTAAAINLIPGDVCDVTVEGGQESAAGTHTARATALSNPNYVLPADPSWDYTIVGDGSDQPGGDTSGHRPGTTQKPTAAHKTCPKDVTCPIWPFTDTSTTAWYHDGVHYCIEKGLMQGYGDQLWAPNDALSRAMLAQILYNREGRPAVTGDSPFADVVAGKWYTGAVTWAAANGVVEGYGNGNFGPTDPITREQMATILCRYAAYKDYDVSKTADLSDYIDKDTISEWALNAMQWANWEGLITGRTSTTLDPKDTATRAEVAAILMRFCENVAGIK